MNLCASRKETEILGHNTHRPPIGRMAKRISDIDAQGNKSDQWYIRNNNRKKISEAERQQMNPKDIKPNLKQQSYTDKNFEKYE